jgi:hypothetical protein
MSAWLHQSGLSCFPAHVGYLLLRSSCTLPSLYPFLTVQLFSCAFSLFFHDCTISWLAAAGEHIYQVCEPRPPIASLYLDMPLRPL